MEYYAALKQILPFATSRMDLEDIMLSEVRQGKASAVAAQSEVSLFHGCSYHVPHPVVQHVPPHPLVTPQ